VAFGLGHLGQEASVANSWSHAGFLPMGVLGPLVALQVVTYAFLGVEMIGVTPGEARNPAVEIRRAIKKLGGRILLFYVGAIAVILMLVPWDRRSTDKSPFVVAWQGIGIPAAAAVLNAVVLTSALSSSNWATWPSRPPSSSTGWRRPSTGPTIGRCSIAAARKELDRRGDRAKH
jgi:amino acid transporter, AAT family